MASNKCVIPLTVYATRSCEVLQIICSVVIIIFNIWFWMDKESLKPLWKTNDGEKRLKIYCRLKSFGFSLIFYNRLRLDTLTDRQFQVNKIMFSLSKNNF